MVKCNQIAIYIWGGKGELFLFRLLNTFRIPGIKHITRAASGGRTTGSGLDLEGTRDGAARSTGSSPRRLGAPPNTTKDMPANGDV